MTKIKICLFVIFAVLNFANFSQALQSELYDELANISTKHGHTYIIEQNGDPVKFISRKDIDTLSGDETAEQLIKKFGPPFSGTLPVLAWPSIERLNRSELKPFKYYWQNAYWFRFEIKGARTLHQDDQLKHIDQLPNFYPPGITITDKIFQSFLFRPFEQYDLTKLDLTKARCQELANFEFELCRHVEMFAKGKEREIFFRRFSNNRLEYIRSIEPESEISISMGYVFSEKETFIAIRRQVSDPDVPNDLKQLKRVFLIYSFKEFVDPGFVGSPKIIIDDPLAKDLRLFDQHGNGTYLLQGVGGCVHICPIETDGFFCEKNFRIK